MYYVLYVVHSAQMYHLCKKNYIPAPKRESNFEDEQRWAKNQKEALENISKKSDGGDNIEPNMDPKILLEKGIFK